MNPLDSGPLTGAGVLGVLALALRLALAWVERGNKRRLERAQSVPPTPGNSPPAAVSQTLSRLDRAEQHDAIVSTLFRVQADLMDRDRQMAILRDECSRLAVRTRALEQDVARKDTQLKAERLATQVLREQLAHVEAEREQLAADLKRALVVRDSEKPR